MINPNFQQVFSKKYFRVSVACFVALQTCCPYVPISFAVFEKLEIANGKQMLCVRLRSRTSHIHYFM